MKIYNVTFLLTLALIMIVVSSCIQSREGLVTPSSTVSGLITSTKVSTPSLTPLPTDTPTPIYTPTFVATLPVERAQAMLLELLSNNADCRLPCLWGITPGESTYQDAQAILAPLSSLSHTVYLSPPAPGNIMPRYIEADLEIYSRVAFLTNLDSNIVNRVVFNTEAHIPIEEGGYKDIFDSKSFGEKIGAYTLSHILSEQGVPSSVMIATSGGPLTRGGTGGFDILLLYPNKGILVNYTTQMYLIGSNVHGCPANAHVEMELYPSGQSEAFFERLKETDWAVKRNYYKPLEEVTSISTEEFYEMFRVSSDKCIETPADVWPIPEP